MPRRRSKTRKNAQKNLDSAVSSGADGEDVDMVKSKDDICLNTSSETNCSEKVTPSPQYSVESGDCDVAKAEFGDTMGTQGKEHEVSTCVKDYSGGIKTCAGDYQEPAECRSGADSDKLKDVNDKITAEQELLVLKKIPSINAVKRGSEENLTPQERDLSEPGLMFQEVENISTDNNRYRNIVSADESQEITHATEEKCANEFESVPGDKIRCSPDIVRNGNAHRSAIEEQQESVVSEGQQEVADVREKEKKNDQDDTEESKAPQNEKVVAETGANEENCVKEIDQNLTHCLPANNSDSPTEFEIRDIMTSNISYDDRKCSLTNTNTISETACEHKLSVNEIKRRFSCHSQKSNEISKLKNSCASTEQEDTATDSKLLRNKERDSRKSASSVFTTELYVASNAGNESCASLLSSKECTSNILVTNDTIKFKSKSAELTHDTESLQSHTEESMVGLIETIPPVKISVRQLRERLISSCSTIVDKSQMENTKQHDEMKFSEMKPNNETNFENHPKGYEKEGYNVSLKERLETYRCQASKAFHHIQSCYIEQELPSVTPVKELQLNFNKTNQPKTEVVFEVNRSKVKCVSELANMQSVSMKCKSCGKQVFLMERIMAEKALWHKKCFRCRECQRQLTVENYKSQNGQLYCESHYNRILKPKPMEDAVSANSVIEEVKIPPLNLKPLFEKSNSSASSSPSTPSTPSIEKSPRFLKRLAKFEGKCLNQSEDDEEEEEEEEEKELNKEIQESDTVKASKVDDLEAYLDEECRKKSENDVSKGWKRSNSICSPKSSCLRVHMKQFFEKTPNDHETGNVKHPEEITSSKILVEGSQSCDVLKKSSHTFKCEDNTSDVRAKISRTSNEDTDKLRCHSTHDIEGLSEGNTICGQARDVQTVISYFNKQ